MESNFNKLALKLYRKLQVQFGDIKIANQYAEVLSKKDDIPEARFFEIDYVEQGKSYGTVAISLDRDDGVVVQLSGELVSDRSKVVHNNIYNFIRSLRQFAKQHLVKFSVRNIGKRSLDRRDYSFQAKRKEPEPMPAIAESKMYGSSRVSYQDLGNTKLLVKHSQPIVDSYAASRSQHIQDIYIETAQGERFRYPYRHLNGARALAEHVDQGGHPYDAIGKYIVGLSEELGQLRKFKNYVGRQQQLSEAMSAVSSRVGDRIAEIKTELMQLQKPAFYQQFAESFVEQELDPIDQNIIDDWTDRLTIRVFNEELKSAFPYLYRLIDSTQLPVKALSPEDILEDQEQVTEGADIGDILPKLTPVGYAAIPAQNNTGGPIKNLSVKLMNSNQSVQLDVAGVANSQQEVWGRLDNLDQHWAIKSAKIPGALIVCKPTFSKVFGAQDVGQFRNKYDFTELQKFKRALDDLGKKYNYEILIGYTLPHNSPANDLEIHFYDRMKSQSNANKILDMLDVALELNSATPRQYIESVRFGEKIVLRDRQAPPTDLVIKRHSPNTIGLVTIPATPYTNLTTDSRTHQNGDLVKIIRYPSGKLPQPDTNPMPKTTSSNMASSSKITRVPPPSAAVTASSSGPRAPKKSSKLTRAEIRTRNAQHLTAQQPASSAKHNDKDDAAVRAAARFSKFESMVPANMLEHVFESFIDSLMTENTGILSSDPAVKQHAIQELNTLLSDQLLAGPHGINAINSLADIIDDSEFLDSFKGIDPELDVRSLVQYYVQQAAPDIAGQLNIENHSLPAGNDSTANNVPTKPQGNPPALEPPPAGESPIGGGRLPMSNELAGGELDMSGEPGETEPSETEPGETEPNELETEPSETEPSNPQTPLAEKFEFGRDLSFKSRVQPSFSFTNKRRAKLRNMFKRAQRAGAQLETMVNFGDQMRTIEDAITECGFSVEECGFSRRSGIDEILEFVEGFWNSTDQNFTLGNTRVKTKVAKAFEEGQFANASQNDVNRVFELIDQRDPASNEHNQIMRLANVPSAKVDARERELEEVIANMNESATDTMKRLITKISQGN